MDAGQVWVIVGSVAGVVAVLVAVWFGIVQVRQGRKAARTDPEASQAARTDPEVSQDVQAERDAYTAGRDQYIDRDRASDE